MVVVLQNLPQKVANLGKNYRDLQLSLFYAEFWGKLNGVCCQIFSRGEKSYNKIK